MVTSIQRQRLKDFLLFSSRLLKAPFSAVENVILTPPGTKHCVVFNKRTSKAASFITADTLDYWTISQIYIDQDYKLAHLKRFDEIMCLYNRRDGLGQQSLILDVGANIGASARYLTAQWPNACVWAIEPSIRNVNLARRNTPVETKIIQAALGSKDGICVITNPDGGPNSFQIQACSEWREGSCPMFSMKTLMREAESSGLQPFILKVDIEGAEVDVFKDARKWLHKWPILMIELHDWMLPKTACSAPVLEAIAAGSRDVVLRGSTLISIANPLGT